MTKNTEKMDGIIRKVKGLLATAADNANENEAQAAFVMAQKMMIKYNIEQSEIEEDNADGVKVVKGQASAHKTLRWYERYIVSLVSNNFRVKAYYNCQRWSNERRMKESVMFYGLESDVQIAKEVYVLMVDALEYYTKLYIDKYYEEFELPRDRTHTSKLKNSYMNGFIQGMSYQFSKQREELEQEYGLVLVTPAIVEESYRELSTTFEEAGELNIPTIEEMEAFANGVIDGSKLDYKQKLIEEEI